MSKLRLPVAFAALCVLVGCSPTPSSNDGGAADTGVNTPVDSGTPFDAGPGPVDAGPMDAGPMDAGPGDAGPTVMYGPESCSGVVNCVTGGIADAGFSVALATECSKTGTADAGAVFGQLFICAQGCASAADVNQCLQQVTAPPDADAGMPDAGPCFSQYVACGNQGLGCAKVLTCIEGAGGSMPAIEGCIGEGTMTAINLSENLVGCEQQVCADAGTGAQACGLASVNPDGGPCYSSLVACETDQSAMP